MATPKKNTGAAQGAAPKTKKYVVTQEDIDGNATFLPEGAKVGDEIDVPDTTPASPAKAKKTPEGTILVDEQLIKVKFGVHFSDMGKTYSKEELLADAEAVAHLVEIGSGAVEIVKPSKDA